MNTAVSKVVQSQLQKTITCHDLILKFHPVGSFPDTTRNKMFHSLCDLVFEHLGAMILLANTGQHFGSAFALLRPLMESCIRAFWVLHIAEDDTLVSIAKRNQDFPGFENARSALESFYQRNNVKLFAIEKRVVKTLHGFTHSGIEQIVHRLDTKHGIIPRYRDRDILEMLNQSARFAVMAAIEAVQQIEGSKDQAAPKAMELMKRFLEIVAN
jgi:hypothetical protein